MRTLTLVAGVLVLGACGGSSSVGIPDSMGPEDVADAVGPDGIAGTDDGGAVCGTCVVHGRWKIDNLSPCFNTSVPGSDGSVEVLGVVSTILEGTMVSCPADLSKAPAAAWSIDALTTDCPGHYRLCVTLKAGDASNPAPADCTVAQSCAEGDYAAGGQQQAWAALPGWIAVGAPAIACANTMYLGGGYSELSVGGTATGCGSVSRAFARIPYCPVSCNLAPAGPGCAACSSGVGDGSF